MYDIYTTKDWYYVQSFAKGGCHREKCTVVFAKPDALKKAKAWAIKNGQLGEVFLYRNNYKREASAMVSTGNFIK